MSDTTISPNMGLIVPTVGQDPGPDWANNLNADLSIIDGHDHSAGSGVQINTNGININADLSLNNNNLVQVNTVNFTAHLASLPGLSPNLGAMYVAGNELYYNDEVGHVVQITNTGSVNAGAGSITGLPSGTAGVTYNNGTQTYVFQSATLTPANLDGGSFIFRDITPSSNGVTVSAPSALAASYQVFLPTALPGSTSFLTLDTSGNIGANTPLLGALTTANLSPSAGILGTQIANLTITASNLANGQITQIKMGAVGQQINANGGFFATASLTPVTVVTTVTSPTTGRPINLITAGSYGTQCNFAGVYGVTGNIVFQVVNQTTSQVVFQTIYSGAAGTTIPLAFPGFTLLDPQPAGTYTYIITLSVSSASITAQITNISLIAYEL